MCTLIILLSALSLTNKIPKGKSQIWDFCVFRNPKFGNSENTKIPNLGFPKTQIKERKRTDLPRNSEDIKKWEYPSYQRH